MPLSGEPLGHEGQVAVGQRLDEGVGHGGRCPLEFADLGGHLVRGGHVEVGTSRRHEAGRLHLVPRICIGVQEHDGHRRHSCPRQVLRPRGHRHRVEWLAHAPIGAHPLRNFQPQVPGHQRRRALDVDVVQLVLALPPDLQGVGEAGGGEQARHRSLALDEGIGEEGGGMHHARDVRRVHSALSEQPRYPGGHGARRVVGRGEDLAVDLVSPLVIVDDEVGEGAADVDAERVAGMESVRVLAGDSTRRARRGEVASRGMRLPAVLLCAVAGLLTASCLGQGERQSRSTSPPACRRCRPPRAPPAVRRVRGDDDEEARGRRADDSPRSHRRRADAPRRMRAPFEWPPDPPEWGARPTAARPGRPPGTLGILLIHGLTDTPFLMRDVAVTSGEALLPRARDPVARPRDGAGRSARGVVPRVDRRRAVRHRQLRRRVDHLYIAGFSTGGTLAVYQALARDEGRAPRWGPDPVLARHPRGRRPGALGQLAQDL